MNPLKALIDIIYPPKCHICDAFLDPVEGELNGESTSICEACFSDLVPIESPYCPICSIPFVSREGDSHLCEDCMRKRPFFSALAAPYVFDGALMSAVHAFKYGTKSYLINPLGPLLTRFARDLFLKTDGLLIMPVPLHPKRLRQRGFNQSALLARHVAKALNTDLDISSLMRIKYTVPQTGLNKKERQKNIRGAFQVQTSAKIKKKKILLIDDVATTGNTLNECARMLRKSGCKDVFSLVLARAVNF